MSTEHNSDPAEQEVKGLEVYEPPRLTAVGSLVDILAGFGSVGPDGGKGTQPGKLGG